MIKDFFKAKEGSQGAGSASGNKMDAEDSSKKQIVENDRFMPFDEFKDGLGTWKTLLAKFSASPKFLAIYNHVNEAYGNPKIRCYPPKEQIFNAFQHTKISDIRVVIVGQDPYHQPGQAMGLCFSVNKGVKVPPSLVNIYKCLAQDKAVKGFTTPKHGDLTKWADQGVLLLNTVLTVEDSKPNSHKDFGWLDFTNEVIRLIATELEGVVFLLWGAPAIKKKEIINKGSKKHHILETVHPSPLSASKGFFDCGHFSKTNELLAADGKTPINWSLD
jgi:uracil-DNA glycosylase